MSSPAMTPETIGHIVMQGERPCTLFNAAQTRRGGALLPAKETEPVVFFGTERDAKRAIKRTERIAGQLKGSLVDDWLKLAPLSSGQPYKTEPVMRSHVAVKKQEAKS